MLLERLKKTISFDKYRKIAPVLMRLHEFSLRLRFFVYTRQEKGKPLRGSLYPKLSAYLSSALGRSVPYLVILLALFGIPYVLPNEFQLLVPPLQYPIPTAFLGAMLTIAGVLLTLFFTSMMTTYSSKYPDGNALISRLFVDSVLNNRSLNFCMSYVTIAVIALVASAFLGFNHAVLIYMGIMSLALIVTIPNIIKLFAQRTELDYVAGIVGNRFLSAALAASTNYSFFHSVSLLNYFQRVANAAISELSELMEFAVAHEKRGHGNADPVADLVLQVLGKYELLRPSIPDESQWHPSIGVHKSWFESDSHEIDLAMSTGTIPFPKTKTNPDGFELRLIDIHKIFRRHLIDSNDTQRYLNCAMHIDIILEVALENGNLSWLSDFAQDYLQEVFLFANQLPENNKEKLLERGQLLEEYSRTITGISLGIMKFCAGVRTDSFRYKEFSTFSREELLKKGYPIANDPKMINCCKQIQRELFVADEAITPDWFFNEIVNKSVVQSMQELGSFIEMQACGFYDNLIHLAENSPRSVYVLVLKETELLSKTRKCLAAITGIVSSCSRNDEQWLNDFKSRIEDKHKSVVKLYPNLISSFQQEESGFKEHIPDIYGFVFFNYCDAVLGDIVRKDFAAFQEKAPALFFLAITSSSNLRSELIDKPYNDRYKAQVILAPLEYFFELCGMAYAMAELEKNATLQDNPIGWARKNLEEYPNEIERWRAILELSEDVFFGGKVFMDMFGWRREFLESAQQCKSYPTSTAWSVFHSTEEPNEEEKRLLEMFPSAAFGSPGDFNGNQVFMKFVFNPAIKQIRDSESQNEQG